MAEKYKVQINYKSGISVTMVFTEFTISRGKISWRVPEGSTKMPLMMNIDEIESIYQVGRG